MSVAAASQYLICIPTYNEKENLPPLVEKILAQDPRLEILVIDDNSPDGTGKIAHQLAEKLGRIRVLSRKKKLGLGTAYIAGFRYAISHHFVGVIQMDADFSHNPEVLPRMLKGLEGADFVIGSRYIKGGGTVNWGWSRKFISGFGNLYARLFLGVPFKDLTGGFNAYRSDVLTAQDLTTIRSEGYCFQIELKTRAHRLGFKGLEVPIMFEDRRVGASKMSTRIVFEAMMRVPFLRFGLPKKRSASSN